MELRTEPGQKSCPARQVSKQEQAALQTEEEVPTHVPPLVARLVELQTQRGEGPDSEGECVRVGEVAYLRALALLQQGQEAAADEVLAALGCSLRLSLHMLQPPGAPSAAASRPHAPAFQPELAPLVFENVVPGGLLASVQLGFAANGPFWSEHRYFNDDTPFFSYFHALADTPQTSLEKVFVRLASQLQRVQFPIPRAPLASVEWWAHIRGADDAHQLHFDMDETRLRRGRPAYVRRHPVWSCVLFLEGGGGPTAVLAQRPGEGPATEAWLIPPRAGRLAVFDGTLLHGVIPGGASLLPPGACLSAIDRAIVVRASHCVVKAGFTVGPSSSHSGSNCPGRVVPFPSC